MTNFDKVKHLSHRANITQLASRIAREGRVKSEFRHHVISILGHSSDDLAMKAAMLLLRKNCPTWFVV